MLKTIKEKIMINREELLEKLDNEEYEQEFIIDNDGLANWAIEQIKNEQLSCDKFEKVAKQQIDELKEKIIKRKEKSEARNSYLKWKLNEYLDTVPTKKSNTQCSFELPNGVIIRKFSKFDFSPKDSKKLNDSKLLINYCKENATEFIENTESVKWGELKKQLEIIKVDEETQYVMNKLTGEIVDCVDIEEVMEKVEVK
jgi:hypothetical protein